MNSFKKLYATALGVAAAGLLLAGTARAADAGCPPGPRPFDDAPGAAPCWTGPDGSRLPFRSFDEAEEFLREARVVSAKPLGEGRTRPLRLMLEKDGVRAQACFRHVDREWRNQRLDDGRLYLLLKDSYRHDLAAYALSRLLGFDRVPPVVERSLDGRRGSFQLWVEGATTEKKRVAREIEPPDLVDFQRQRHMLRVFDALVANVDRNLGNILIDAEWNLWYIDHTRTFERFQELGFFDPGMGIDRQVYGRLASLGEDEIQAALRPWVGTWEIRDLLERRQQILERFRPEIARQGENNAFF